MKYRLSFKCSEPLELPQQYNKILQSALLHWIGDNSYTEFLHDAGYLNHKRVYKLYNFSNIIGKYSIDRQHKRIIFYDKIQIYLSFYLDNSHEMILQNIKTQKPIRFGNRLYDFIQCELIQEKMQPCVVRTLSPVTVHSTFFSSDAKKKTYYYSPQEKDFGIQIRENLIRRYEAFFENDPPSKEFSVRAVNANCKESIVVYDHFIIKGYLGQFALYGSEDLIRLALLTGIGARNGIGMGFILQENIL